jgi:hypothetical protein
MITLCFKWNRTCRGYSLWLNSLCNTTTKGEKASTTGLSMVHEVKKTTGFDRPSAEFRKPDPSPRLLVLKSAGLNGSEHSHATEHLEYVLVPKPFLEMAVALVLERKRLRSDRGDKGSPKNPERKLLGALTGVFSLFTGSKFSAH